MILERASRTILFFAQFLIVQDMNFIVIVTVIVHNYYNKGIIESTRARLQKV